MISHSVIPCVFNVSELLSLIFTFCLPDSPREVERNPEDWSLDVNSQLQYPSISEEKAPLSLAHVNRHWRSEAFATAELWACVHLHMDRPYYVEDVWLKRRLNALQFWLKQSRSLPFSVRISRSKRFGQRSGPSETAGMDSIFLTAMVDTLLKHTNRWENISIDLPESALSPFYHPSNYKFPCLETFELKHELSDHPLRKRDIFHRSAPNLRSLAISGVLPSELPSSLRSLSYSNMTMCVNRHPRGTLVKELVLSNVVISDKAVIRFSAAFPLLEKLVVSFVIRTRRVHGDPPQEDDLVDDEPKNCFLDNLISLSVQCKGSYFPLTLMSAPVLAELKVVTIKTSSEFNRWDNRGGTIIEFLKRSNTSLQKFSYSTGGDEATNAHLGDILRAMPDLRELSVKNPKLCHSDLVMLQDPAVCPRLSVVHSFGEIIVRDNWHAICDDKDEPNVMDIIDVIRARCRKRGPVDCGFEQVKEVARTRDRVWVKRLELPLHKEDEEMLRKNSTFRMADVEFFNTHKCTGGYWCGRECIAAVERGRMSMYEGRFDY